jgi:hypothetical protein
MIPSLDHSSVLLIQPQSMFSLEQYEIEVDAYIYTYWDQVWASEDRV